MSAVNLEEYVSVVIYQLCTFNIANIDVFYIILYWPRIDFLIKLLIYRKVNLNSVNITLIDIM